MTPTVVVSTNNTDVNVANDTATVTFAFSEAPNNFTLADTSAVGGSPSGLSEGTTPAFTTIDDPLGPTYAFSYAGINDAGQVVGSYIVNGTAHGFLYSGGTYTALPDDPSANTSTFANGINNAGQIAGQYGIDGNYLPVGYLNSGGTFTDIIDPLSSGPPQIVAIGINNETQVVGYYTVGADQFGFLYSGGTYVTLDDPAAGGIVTQANGINDLGQIVGTYYTTHTGNPNAFLYSNGTYTTINDPLGVNGTSALGINNEGQVVGYYATVTAPNTVS